MTIIQSTGGTLLTGGTVMPQTGGVVQPATGGAVISGGRVMEGSTTKRSRHGASAPTYLVYHDFSLLPDGPIGTATTGQTWQVGTQGYAEVVSGGVHGGNLYALDLGSRALDVRLTLGSPIGSTVNLLFDVLFGAERFSRFYWNNGWLISLSGTSAGSSSIGDLSYDVIGSGAAGQPAIGAVIRLVVAGTHISGYVDDVLELDIPNAAAPPPVGGYPPPTGWTYAPTTVYGFGYYSHPTKYRKFTAAAL